MPALRIQYKDYSTWQNKLMNSQTIKEQEAYWLSTLKQPIPELKLPVDFMNQSMKSFAGDRVRLRLNKEIINQLKSIAIKA